MPGLLERKRAPREPKRGRCAGLLRAAAAILLTPLLIGPTQAVPARSFVAVMHPANPTVELSVRGLRLIYGGYRRSWPDGTPIHLLLPAPDTPPMDFVVRRVFKKSREDQVLRYYRQAVFQQRLTREPSQLSVAAALSRLQRDPGAIVVLERGSVPQSASLKVIPLDGG